MVTGQQLRSTRMGDKKIKRTENSFALPTQCEVIIREIQKDLWSMKHQDKLKMWFDSSLISISRKITHIGENE